MHRVADSKLWRTKWEPLPDITAFEIALDMKYVNASQIVASYKFDGDSLWLRHRVCDDSGRRMDVVLREYRAALAQAEEEKL